MSVAESGAGRDCRMALSTTAPALAARVFNSSSDSAAVKGGAPVDARASLAERNVASRPTRIARSWPADVNLSCYSSDDSVGTGGPGTCCDDAEAAEPCAEEWNGLDTTTVEIACLKISCSWLLVSRTTEYLSKLFMRPESLTPLIK